MTAYVNVHGKPVTVSARDAVVALHPDAVCKRDDLLTGCMWVVRRNSGRFATLIGTGHNEEAAWREAWSRLLTESMEKAS